MKEEAPEDVVTTISAGNSWALFDFGELRRYRDLFYFLVWRDIKVLYAQTILGFSWAILNPLVQYSPDRWRLFPLFTHDPPAKISNNDPWTN